MNSALLPIALYLCLIVVGIFSWWNLVYLCLIIYNSITCGCASCSAHRKLLEGYVGLSHAPRDTSYQHTTNTTSSTADTLVLRVYLLVIVIMYTAGQIMESQA